MVDLNSRMSQVVVDPAWAGVGSYTIVVRDHLGHATEVPVNIVSDFTAPTIAAVNLPDNPSLQFDVAWDGADGDSGIQSYEVQYTCAGCMQPGTLPVVNAPKHSASFTGQNGVSYTFSVRARDRVGNVSQWVSAEPIKVQTETKYYLFGGRRVAMSLGSSPIAQERTVYYFHTNHLGSVVLTTDAAGAAVSQTRYLPFGEEHWSSGGSLSDFTYTGQRNTDFGLMDYNARFYSSRLGRFASADTVIPGAVNPIAWDRYMYALGNPIRMVDPSGHSACDGPHGGDPECVNTESGVTLDQSTNDQTEATLPSPNDVITTVVIVVDGVSMLVSGVEAIVADVVGGEIILIGCGATGLETGGVGCGAVVVFALTVDAAIASYASPIGAVENILGYFSTGLTWLSDQDNVMATDLSYVSIGKDTIISARNTLLGHIPESNIDAGISYSQFKYDLERAGGIDPGGSVIIYDWTYGINPALGEELLNIILTDW